MNLAASLGSLGEPVLLLDLDPQSNSTSGVGIASTEVTHSIYTVLAGTSSPGRQSARTKPPDSRCYQRAETPSEPRLSL